MDESDPEEKRRIVTVPAERLSASALSSLIEEFVSRDGTDYGAVETSLADKSAQVRRQLQRGELLIVFDTGSESCNIMEAQEYARRLRQ